METGNLYPQPDGEIVQTVIESGLGTGVWSARFLPGARVVRAFNTVWDQTLAKAIAEGHGDRIGIPLAGDDPAARASAFFRVSPPAITASEWGKGQNQIRYGANRP